MVVLKKEEARDWDSGLVGASLDDAGDPKGEV